MRTLALLVACASATRLFGCRSASSTPEPASSAAHVAAMASTTVPVASADPSHLPEDPAAGKRSEEQWREHMAFEEHERQIGFDSRHSKEHRAVVARITAARQSYDRAKTAAALARTSAAMPRQIDEIRRRVTEIDHWGVNSHLLPDYVALETMLEKSYPDAKLSALNGDATTLDAIRKDFDARLKAIGDWLEEAAESADE